MSKEHITVWFSEEDSCWLALSQLFSFVRTHGQTREEALKEMKYLLSIVLDKGDLDLDKKDL